MKASTLFAIVVALLLGLGAAATARYTGLFKEKTVPPPEPPKPVAKVLVPITTPNGGAPSLRTACLARGCKVVMKRNNPWPVLAPAKEEGPMHFALQANPYRAALIEHARQVGALSLQPVPGPSRKAGSGSF